MASADSQDKGTSVPFFHPGADAPGELLAAAGLPGRWAGRDHFVLLSAGLPAAALVLAAWRAWQADAARCGRLSLVVVDARGSAFADAALDHADGADATTAAADAQRAQALRAAWPPSTPGLQRIHLASGAISVDLLRATPLRDGLRALRLQADALLLSGAWDVHLLRRLGMLAAPQATLVADDAGLAPGLVSAGFQIEPPAAPERWLRARYAPRFTPRLAGPSPAPSSTSPDADRDVLVIGAGLAGAACAQALAAAGCQVTVLEARAAPAQAASGNPGGLFHGIVNPQDGLHARFNRAAALTAARSYAPLLAAGTVPGRIEGLLRLAPDAPDAAALQTQADRVGLPADYVHAVQAEAAAAMAGLPLSATAWCYPQGGWLDPRALVRHGLQQAGITLRNGTAVAALQATADGRWQALDAAGAVLATARRVVLCNAEDSLRLLQQPDWPLERQRGQLTVLPADTPGLRRPKLPVAGGGYVLTLDDGRVLCGATAQAGDADPATRPEDDAENLRRYDRLAGTALADTALADTTLSGTASSNTTPLPVQGRTAFRLLAGDRLPLVGAVPLPGASADQPRRIARVPGLFVCTALGSRGITWAPLAAELLAALVLGRPLPVEADLADALDPARFAARLARKPRP